MEKLLLKQLSDALEVLKQSLVDWWYVWVNLAVINFIWLISILTILFAFPATFGLFYAGREAARKRDVGIGDFVKGFREYFFRAWQWGLVNVVAAVLFYANILFYSQVGEAWSFALLYLSLFLALLWALVQLYAIPYLMEQEIPHLRVAYKNAAFTLLASPIYTFVLLLFVALLVGLTLWQPALLIAGFAPLIAIVANHAVHERLQTFGIKERPVEVDESVS
jgi:uncharacterized membrane protein YesL